jgi:hypothetical protein
MKWEWIGTGLALISIGVTACLALPPPWWSKMPPAMVTGGLFVGSYFIIFGSATTLIGIFPAMSSHITSVFIGAISICSMTTAIMVFLKEGTREPHPRVVVTHFPGQPGPYTPFIVNDTREPFINVSMTIRNAGSFMLSSSSYKLGDIEPGMYPISGMPAIDVGLWQINIVYRGSHIMQMLNVQSHNGTLAQESSFSDGQTIEESDKKIPQPIANINLPYEDGDIHFDNVYFAVPMEYDGMHVDYVSLSIKNMTGEIVNGGISSLAIFADGVLIAKSVNDNTIQIGPSSGAMTNVQLNKVVDIQTKEIAIEAKAESTSVSGHKQTILRHFSFRVSFEDGFPKLEYNNTSSEMFSPR